MEINRGFRVLDFGCGDGGYSLAAAEKTGENGIVYALDNQLAALERVEEKAGRLGLKNIKTIRSNDLFLLPDASMDVVLLLDNFHLLDYPEKILAEIQRILKPDSRLYVNDLHMKAGDIIMRIALSGKFILKKQGKWVLLFQKIVPFKQAWIPLPEFQKHNG